MTWKIIMWIGRLDMRSINDGREISEIRKSRNMEELKGKSGNLRRSQLHPAGDLFRFVLMPLVSAQHPALRPTVLSVELGCFSASDWTLSRVSPVDVGVYWCSLPVVVGLLKVLPEMMPLQAIMISGCIALSCLFAFAVGTEDLADLGETGSVNKAL